MNLKLIINEAVGCVSDVCMNCVPGDVSPSFSSSAHMNRNTFADHMNYLLITEVTHFFLLALQNMDILL